MGVLDALFAFYAVITPVLIVCAIGAFISDTLLGNFAPRHRRFHMRDCK